TLTKLTSTYVDTLPALVDNNTGRLHTRFNQTGTATGRLSSRDPNLQNIPIREEEGRHIRRAFIPRDGGLFISADYSQIELVVLSHLSGDQELRKAFLQGADVHSQTAALIFDVPLEEVTADQRRIAKTINFGVMYGMSAFRLSAELGIPRGRAEDFIRAYYRRFKGIDEFKQKIIRRAEKEGYVTTLLGRRRPVSGINSRNRTEKAAAERVAVNTPIQGTAADLVKLAMMRTTERIRSEGLKTRLLLQVHDELIFECPREEREAAEKCIREEMERVYELSVPLRVNIETGVSWGEFH
ncbi:MAG: DNA polymerase I, partial [Spirochaetales bacterium]|nr:DNA polymerase I [Spirochaetales bacterium]